MSEYWFHKNSRCFHMIFIVYNWFHKSSDGSHKTYRWFRKIVVAWILIQQWGGAGGVGTAHIVTTTTNDNNNNNNNNNTNTNTNTNSNNIWKGGELLVCGSVPWLHWWSWFFASAGVILPSLVGNMPFLVSHGADLDLVGLAFRKVTKPYWQADVFFFPSLNDKTLDRINCIKPMFFFLSRPD